MKYTISHLYQTGEGVWVFQSNEEHTAGVATRAAQLAEKFGMASWGNVLGFCMTKAKNRKPFNNTSEKQVATIPMPSLTETITMPTWAE